MPWVHRLVCRSCRAVLPDNVKDFRRHCQVLCPQWLNDRAQPPSEEITSERHWQPKRYLYCCHACRPRHSGRGRFDGCFGNKYDQARHEWKRHKTYELVYEPGCSNSSSVEPENSPEPELLQPSLTPAQAPKLILDTKNLDIDLLGIEPFGSPLIDPAELELETNQPSYLSFDTKLPSGCFQVRIDGPEPPASLFHDSGDTEKDLPSEASGQPLTPPITPGNPAALQTPTRSKRKGKKPVTTAILPSPSPISVNPEVFLSSQYDQAIPQTSWLHCNLRPAQQAYPRSAQLSSPIPSPSRLHQWGSSDSPMSQRSAGPYLPVLNPNVYMGTSPMYSPMDQFMSVSPQTPTRTQYSQPTSTGQLINLYSTVPPNPGPSTQPLQYDYKIPTPIPYLSQGPTYQSTLYNPPSSNDLSTIDQSLYQTNPSTLPDPTPADTFLAEIDTELGVLADFDAGFTAVLESPYVSNAADESYTDGVGWEDYARLQVGDYR